MNNCSYFFIFIIFLFSITRAQNFSIFCSDLRIETDVAYRASNYRSNPDYYPPNSYHHKPHQSKLNKTGKKLANMSEFDLDRYFKRQKVLLNLCDIQQILDIYTSLNNDQNADKYRDLSRFIDRMISISSNLTNVDKFDNVTYSADGLIDNMDSIEISYTFDQVSKIDTVSFNYTFDLLTKIDTLKITYDNYQITSIGEYKLNTPVVNRRFKRLSAMDKIHLFDRYKTLPGLIGVYNVLNLYITNCSFNGKPVNDQYLKLYEVTGDAINTVLHTMDEDRSDAKEINYRFGLIDRIGEQNFNYFFNHVSRIGDINISYFFEQVTRIGDLNVYWRFGDIVKIGDIDFD